MSTQAIESFFHSVYRPGRAWGTPEMLDEFYAHVAPDFIFHRPPFPSVTGLEANRRDDEAMAVAFSNSRVTIEELVVCGEVAMLRYIWEGDHTGVSPSLGIPPTGKHIKAQGCFVSHWQAGQLVEMWDYLDLLGLLQQVGVVPA